MVRHLKYLILVGQLSNVVTVIQRLIPLALTGVIELVEHL
jgi:hypothetical protein